MNEVFVSGLGAVSAAGSGVAALRDALRRNEPLPVSPLSRPGWSKPLPTRPVPAPATRPAFLAHPRLRRSSAITQHAVAAALEALGDEVATVQSGALRLRIIVCLMPGCVTYSRRFYEEVLQNPATASPMLFPETVFNAPASHLAAYLNSADTAYTLVGDDGCFLQGLALAGSWLLQAQADACLVVAAEELDWIVADAVQLFTRRVVQAGGAGAICLRAGKPRPSAIRLAGVTEPVCFSSLKQRALAAKGMRAQLPTSSPDELLCLSSHGLPSDDSAELEAWRDWTATRLMPRQMLGEAFTAAAAWQCVAAADALRQGAFTAANVSVVGANEQAIGARFERVA